MTTVLYNQSEVSKLICITNNNTRIDQWHDTGHADYSGSKSTRFCTVTIQTADLHYKFNPFKMSMSQKLDSTMKKMDILYHSLGVFSVWVSLLQIIK